MSGDIQEYNLLVILGPTASGKTRIGVRLAMALGGEIISADSRQVYRGMDIGTGKDLKEYGSVPYHLIDIVDPGYEFSVFEFQRHFSRAWAEIQGRGKLPILVGGTGLYLDAILRKYRMTEVPANYELRKESAKSPLEDLAARLKAANPKLHNTTDLLDRERVIRAIEIAEYKREAEDGFPLPELKPVVFGILWPREALHQRISQRLRERMNQGMIEEGKRLLGSGVSSRTLDFYGLEYRFIARYLAGDLNRNDFFQKLGSAIRQLAKRQETWFRRMERQGILVHWVAGDKDPAVEILRILKEKAIVR